MSSFFTPFAGSSNFGAEFTALLSIRICIMYFKVILYLSLIICTYSFSHKIFEKFCGTKPAFFINAPKYKNIAVIDQIALSGINFAVFYPKMLKPQLSYESDSRLPFTSHRFFKMYLDNITI